MWTMTPIGFYSAVRKPGDSFLTIRARASGDLDALRARYLPALSPTRAGGGTGRQTNFEQVSINNMSRIEVIQSPTPESQGSALGGSVNMIPRSAFERSRHHASALRRG